MSDVTARFGGDVGPLEKAVARSAAMLRDMKKDADRNLTIRPQLDTSGIRSDWDKFVKAAHRTAADDYLDQVYGRLQQQQQSALSRRGMPGQSAVPGGGGKFALGQASMQFQDIAVQAQAGTSAVTILAQQGSQLASVFGPTGRIVGGVLAIGAAITTMALKGRKEWDKLTEGAREFNAETAKVLENGTLQQVSEQIGKVSENQRQLQNSAPIDYIGAAAGDITKYADIFAQISPALTLSAAALQHYAGFKSQEEQSLDRANMDAHQDFAKVALRKRQLELSQQELDLVRLRVAGEDVEVAKLQRQIQLKKDIAEVNKLDASEFRKNQMIANYTAAVKLQDDKADKDAKEAQRVKDEQYQREGQERLAKQRAPGIREEDEASRLRQQIRENGAEAALRGQSPTDQAVTLRARAAELQRQGASFAGEVPEAEQLKLQIEINKLLERAKEIESDVSKRDATVAAAREQWDLEQRIVDARADAGGKEDDKVKALEKQARLMQIQKQLMDTLNLDAGEAAKYASARVDSEDRATQAATQRQQTEAKISIAKQAAITHARAHGHRTEANRLQREGEIEARAKDIQQQTGASPEVAQAQAEMMQRDVDRLNGSRKIYGGVSKPGFEGIDGKKTPGLDAFRAKQGKPLSDQFTFPGLDAQRRTGMIAPNLGPPLSEQKQQATAQQAAENAVSITDGPQIVKLLSEIVSNLTLAA